MPCPARIIGAVAVDTAELAVVGEAEGAGAALVAAEAWLDECQNATSTADCEDALSQCCGWLGYLVQDVTRLGAQEVIPYAQQAVSVCSQAQAAGIVPDLGTWQAQTLPALQAAVANIAVGPLSGYAGVRHAGWIAFWALVGAGVSIAGMSVLADYLARHGKLLPAPHQVPVTATRYD